MKKKLLAVLLASATAMTACAGLAACGGEDLTNTITVWCPDAAISTYEDRVASYKEKYPEYANYSFRFEGKGEGDSLSACQADINTAADIFFFASDHIETMVTNGYLQPLSKNYADAVTERDDETAVAEITKDGKVYGFPATNDNGYLLFYDKDVFTSPDQVATLDGIVGKAYNQGTNSKNVLFKFDDAFYGVTFFVAAGCEFGYNAQGKYECDFDSQKGKNAAQAAYRYLAPTNNHSTVSNGTATGGTILSYGENDAPGKAFAQDTCIAAIGGTWCNDDLLKSGKNIGYAKLPTIMLGGQDVPMGSFMSAKYGGVNPAITSVRSENKILASMAFLDWLTNEEGQKARYEDSSAGPSNKNVANSDAVQQDEMLKALWAQNDACGYVQRNQANMWDFVAGFNKDIYNGKVTSNDVTDTSADAKEGTLGRRLGDLARGLNALTLGGAAS